MNQSNFKKIDYLRANLPLYVNNIYVPSITKAFINFTLIVDASVEMMHLFLDPINFITYNRSNDQMKVAFKKKIIEKSGEKKEKKILRNIGKLFDRIEIMSYFKATTVGFLSSLALMALSVVSLYSGMFQALLLPMSLVWPKPGLTPTYPSWMPANMASYLNYIPAVTTVGLSRKLMAIVIQFLACLVPFVVSVFVFTEKKASAVQSST